MSSLFISIEHEKHLGLDLTDGLLSIKSKDGANKPLEDKVEHIAASVFDQQLRIVAFLNQDYAWFLSGATNLNREKIELGHKYGGGGQLITDKKGNSHLFYFINQSPGPGAVLRHHKFDGSWSVSSLVTTNVSNHISGYTVGCKDDSIIHVAYCDHRDSNLLYRAYDFEHNMWSGAVPFSRGKCSYPQFILGDRLYLFWFEERDKIDLRVRTLDNNWSPISDISSLNHHASSMGYAFRGGKGSILWMEEGKLYQSAFDNWSEHTELERKDYDYVLLSLGGSTIPFYETKSALVHEEVVEEPVKIDSEVKPTKKDEHKEEERKIQASFVEKAFHTMKEWETLKTDLNRLKYELKMQEPIDLTPLITRLDRIERKFLLWQQGEEKRKKEFGNSSKYAEQEIRNLKQRIIVLENEHKKAKSSLLLRVLRRF